MRADRRGVVMMEFMMALLPVMLAFLGFTQFCFAGIAKLTVRHAAQLAARAAVVVIEESKDVPGAPADIYSEEKAGLLETTRPQPQQKGSAASVNQAQNQVGNLSGSGNSGASAQQNMVDIFGSAERSDSRIKQIRTAAYIPLLAISPSLIDEGVQLGQSLGSGELFPKLNVRNAIGKSGLDRITGALLYNLGAVAVTFPDKANGSELTGGLFGSEGKLDELVTTRVSYLFRCQVPLASLLMCTSGWALMFGDAWIDPVSINSIANTVGNPPKNAEDLPQWADEWKRQKAIHDRQQRRVDAFKGHEKEFREVEWPFMLDVLLAMPGSRYLVLTADAQLPLQGARYYPRADSDDQKKMWDEQDKNRQQNGGSTPDLRGSLQPVADAVGGAVRKLDDAVSQVQAKIDEIESAIEKGVGAAKAKVSEVKTMTQDMVDDAKAAFDDVKAQVDDKVKVAKDTFDSAKKQAQTTLDAVKTQANQIKEGAQDKLDDAKAELRAAKKQGQAALAEAQRKVDEAQRGVDEAKSRTEGMVADAQQTANQKIAQAQQQLDQVESEGQAMLDDAKANLSDAQQSAKDLNKEANQALADAKRGAGALGKDLQRQAGQALSGVQSGVSQAGSALGDNLQKGVQNASKSVGDALKDTTKSMPGTPGAPGSMSLDQF